MSSSTSSFAAVSALSSANLLVSAANNFYPAHHNYLHSAADLNSYIPSGGQSGITAGQHYQHASFAGWQPSSAATVFGSSTDQPFVLQDPFTVAAHPQNHELSGGCTDLFRSEMFRQANSGNCFEKSSFYSTGIFATESATFSDGTSQLLDTTNCLTQHDDIILQPTHFLHQPLALWSSSSTAHSNDEQLLYPCLKVGENLANVDRAMIAKYPPSLDYSSWHNNYNSLDTDLNGCELAGTTLSFGESNSISSSSDEVIEISLMKFDEKRKETTRTSEMQKAHQKKLSASFEKKKRFANNGVANFMCNVCGRGYCRKSTLKAHLKHHTGGRSFTCQLCGKCFSQAANLTAHKRIHTGEKPFFCSICLRPFSQSSSLVTHKRTHTGERPYPCQHCAKSFTDSSTLTKHMRTHTGNKPYSCSICLMRFSQSGNLHRHMKTHVNGHC